MANINKNKMNRKDSKLFAETRSVLNTIVRTSFPWVVPKPVRMTYAMHPLSGAKYINCNNLII